MTALTFDIQSELPRAVIWTDTLIKQLPFAASQALNATAFDVRAKLNTSTASYFDKPNRFTQTAFFVNRSNKRALEAEVFAEAAKGKDRARYLRYGIQGGTRRQKGFELKFLNEVASTRTIPANARFIPTRLVKLDGSGNVSLATIRRISKGLNGSARGGFFVGQPRNNHGLPPGIYRRSREQLFPYFFATDRAPRYRARFPMEQIGQTEAQRVFGAHFRSSLEKALATAR